MDDSAEDAELVRLELQRGGYQPEWERVDTAPALVEALERHSWDVILCDYVMPQFSAPAALALLRERGCDLPVIIVSGQVGEEVAATTMRAGAHDYVSKHKLARLVPAVERELAEVEVRRARTRTDQALRESEDRYRDLVEHSEDLICTHDLEGRIVSVNAAPARTLGYEQPDLLNKNIRDILAPEVRERFGDYLETIRRDGRAEGLMTMQTRSGERRIWEYRNTLRTEGVATPIVRGVAHDITERRRAEQALRTEKVFSDAIIASVSGTFYVLDRQGRFVRWNKAQEELTGLSASQLQHMDALLTVHADDRPLVARTIEQVFQQGFAAVEARLAATGGAARHFMLSGKRMDIDDVAYLVGVGIDITERKRIEDALHESEDRYRRVTENAHDLIAELGEHGQVLYVSPNHKDVLGYDPSELVGTNSLDLIHPDDRHAVRTARAHSAVGVIFRCRHKNQEWRYFEATGKAFQTASGARRAVVNSRDVTDRTRMEEALRRSEERYRSLVENLNDVIFVTDTHATVTYISPAVELLSGYSAEELTGQSYARFVHPDDLPHLHASFERTLRGELEPTEFRVFDRQGQIRRVRTSSRPLYEDGQLAGIAGIVVDVTERRQIEEALRQSEQRYREVFEHTSDCIFLLDVTVDGGFRFAGLNPAEERILGLADAQVTGKYLEEVLPKDVVHTVQANYRRCIDSGSPVTYEEVLDLPPGRAWFQTTLFPMKDASGRVQRIVGIAQNTTERRRADEEIRTLNEVLEARIRERTAQLEAANKELGAFSHSVSHDLRAPLRHVAEFSRLLLEEHAADLDSRARHYLDRIYAGTHRMGQLIEDLLSLSRVTLGEMASDEVNLSDLAHAIAADLQKSQPHRPVEFVIAPGLIAKGDTRLLRVALENLLRNAWKYTSKHPAARIEFGVIAGGQGSGGAAEISPAPPPPSSPAIFYVRDDGAGFDMAYADKLFGAFQRLHGESEFEGTGIGLATVQRIVHRHGGRVWAEAAVERGATIYFTLELSGL